MEMTSWEEGNIQPQLQCEEHWVFALANVPLANSVSVPGKTLKDG